MLLETPLMGSGGQRWDITRSPGLNVRGDDGTV